MERRDSRVMVFSLCDHTLRCIRWTERANERYRQQMQAVVAVATWSLPGEFQMSMAMKALRCFAHPLVTGLLLVLPATSVHSAELRMRATGAVQHTLIELAEAFQKATGHAVKAEFGTAGAVAADVLASKPIQGGTVDLVFSSEGSLQSADMVSRLAADTTAVVGRVRIGIGVRNGDTAPDISTPEALKAALLAAPSFAYGDPATGATTGVHFAKLLETMGIVEAVKAKSVLRRGGLLVMKEVAEGKAAFGFTQTSEIKAVPGVKIAGYLPDQFQLVTAYAGAVTKDAAEPAVAKVFLAFVTGPAGQTAFRDHGFEVAPR
jgi:molybdate transport system substrate-binding protein